MVTGGGEWAERMLASLGWTCTLLHVKWTADKDLLNREQGTLLSVKWQTGCEGSLGENGYIDTYS